MGKLRVFEAFAGVGSQSMALRNIGCKYEVVGISDVDKYALIAYDAIHNNDEHVDRKTKEEMLQEIKSKNIAYNFSTGKSEIPKKEEDIRKLYEAHVRNKNYGDIRLINTIELPDFDLFTYSFPCKNISLAGQQGGLEYGSDTQSSLLWECERVIIDKKPKFLMMENVKNLVGKKHINQFNKWCKWLEDNGYVNYWRVLNGKNYGVPQNRERVIMISVIKDIKTPFIFPEEKENRRCIKDILENNADEKLYVNKPFYFVNKGHQAEFENVKREESRRIYSEENSTMRTLKSIERGQNNILVKAKLYGNREDRIRVISEDGLCHTLDSMNGGNREPKIIQKNIFNKDIFELDGYVVRKLSPLECWRLMGFSDEDYDKAKNAGLSNSKLYERAGRGIVVPMLEEIFKEIIKIFKEGTDTDMDNCDLCKSKVDTGELINIDPYMTEEVNDIIDEFNDFDGMVCESCYNNMLK